MPTNIIMPMLSPDVQEAILVKWLKKEKDRVEEGEPLFVAETEKVTVEVDAPTSGVLSKILISEGSNIRTAEKVGVITESVEGK